MTTRQEESNLLALSAIVQSNLDDAEEGVERTKGPAGDLGHGEWMQYREAQRNWAAAKRNMERLALWREPPKEVP